MIKKNLFVLLPMSIVVSFSFQCQKRLSCEGCALPVANAGRDAIIFLPADSAMLDGGASIDRDGNIKEYLWSKVSGPVSFLISYPNAQKTSVRKLTVGVYQFELKVTDDKGLTARDTVMIKVNPINNHNAPVAHAGPDQEIVLPVNTASLDGSASTDPDSNIIRYYWTNVSGPSTVTISNAVTAQVQVTSLSEGVYEFELIVTDGDGLIGRDTLQVKVNSATCDGRPYINATLIPVGSLSAGRMGMKCAAAGNKIIFAGGWTPTLTSIVDILDLSTNTWSASELASDINWRDGFAVASLGNKIFIAGGGDPIGDWASSMVNIFDASTNSWSTASLSVPRQGLSAAVVGNKIFFAGGGYADYTSWVYSNVVDIYDDVSGTWTTDKLSEGRSDLSAVTVGNKIYFAGGSIAMGQSLGVSKTIDIFDAANNSWSVSSLQAAKTAMAGFAVEDNIFWASGYTGLSSSGWSYSNQVEIRDIATGNSSFACMLPKAYFNAVMKNDNIVFFPGLSEASSPVSNTYFEIYNISSDTWSVGVLNQKITGAAIISVNNKIYVAGGTDGSKYLDKVYELEF